MASESLQQTDGQRSRRPVRTSLLPTPAHQPSTRPSSSPCAWLFFIYRMRVMVKPIFRRVGVRLVSERTDSIEPSKPAAIFRLQNHHFLRRARQDSNLRFISCVLPAN